MIPPDYVPTLIAYAGFLTILLLITLGGIISQLRSIADQLKRLADQRDAAKKKEEKWPINYHPATPSGSNRTSRSRK